MYAVDLLGFGSSEKADVPYSIELWRDQVLAFAHEFTDAPPVLVGNSIGSLVSLAAAAQGGGSAVRAAALLNCAGVPCNLLPGACNDRL